MFNRVEDRVKAYMALEKRVFEETGERTLYTVNVYRQPAQDVRYRPARRGRRGQRHDGQLPGGGPAGHAGAGRGRRAINVPILAHMDCAGAVVRVALLAASSSHLVLGKLPRLAGADVVVFPAPYGKAPFLKGTLPAVCRRHDLSHARPQADHAHALGRHHPADGARRCVADLGPDIMIGSGGGVHAHPMGPAAGARAFRQAIDATMQGIPLEEYAKDHQELAVAMGIWTGVFYENKA